MFSRVLLVGLVCAFASDYQLSAPAEGHEEEVVDVQIDTVQRHNVAREVPDNLWVEILRQGRTHQLRFERKSMDPVRHHIHEGGRVRKGPVPEACFYTGHVVGVPDSSATISTCRGGLSGVIAGLSNATVTIGPLHPSRATLDTTASGGPHRMRFLGEAPIPQPRLARRLQASTKYAEITVVNDVEFINQFQGPSKFEDVVLYDVTVMNMVHNSYKTPPSSGAFPHVIECALVEIHSFTDQDPWANEPEVQPDADGLTDPGWLRYYFRTYTLTQIQSGGWYDTDLRALFTGRPLKGLVGFAVSSTMCSPENSASIQVCRPDGEYRCAMLTAHEMGHTLGMNHDYADASNGNQACYSLQDSPALIMWSWTGSNQLTFSSCSANDMATYFQDFYDANRVPQCLENPPSKCWADSFCGNGVVEVDEDCDCGLPDCSTLDPCCNGATCKYADPSYECSDFSDPACCSSCLYAASDNPCSCPHAYSGQSCTFTHAGTSYAGLCAGGVCQSMDATCAVELSQTYSSEWDLTPSCHAFNDDCAAAVCHIGYFEGSTVQCEHRFNADLVPEGMPCWLKTDPRSTRNGICQAGSCVSRSSADDSCGNGHIDYGEECDCGAVGDPCCDCSTCKLIAGAQCASSEACCTQSCQFASAKTVCRPSVGFCDLTESCDGLSARCPLDKGLPVATPCPTDGETCYGKQCLPNLDDQCGMSFEQGFLAARNEGSAPHEYAGHSCQELTCCKTCSAGAGDSCAGAFVISSSQVSVSVIGGSWNDAATFSVDGNVVTVTFVLPVVVGPGPTYGYVRARIPQDLKLRPKMDRTDFETYDSSAPYKPGFLCKWGEGNHQKIWFKYESNRGSNLWVSDKTRVEIPQGQQCTYPNEESCTAPPEDPDVVYSVLPDKHCEGNSITQWSDGSTSNYGQDAGGVDPEACKATCSQHAECAGFVQANGRCSYWKSKYLNPRVSSGVSCYFKQRLSDTVGFQLLQDTRCESEKIYDWDNGESAGYGSGYRSLETCRLMCSERAECAGFLERVSDGVCTFWRSASQPLRLSPEPGINCYAREGSGGALQAADVSACTYCGQYSPPRVRAYAYGSVAGTLYPGAAMDGTVLANQNSMCLKGQAVEIARTCSGQEFLESSIGQCLPCDAACAGCSGPSSLDCLECAFGSRDSRGMCGLPTTVTTTAPFTHLPSLTCGGLELNCAQWSDGTVSSFGKAGPNNEYTNIAKCKEACSSQSSCRGFRQDLASGICSYWQVGAVSTAPDTGSDCYERESWILIMKVQGNTNFGFNSPYWTNNQVLNEVSPGVAAEDAKYSTFSSVPFTHIRMCVDSAGENCVDHAFSNRWDNAAALFNAGVIDDALLDQFSMLEAFKPPVGSYSTCPMIRPGFNIQCGGGPSVRWGYCSNCKSVSCSDVSIDGAAAIGLGLAEGGLQRGAGWTELFASGDTCTPTAPTIPTVWLYVAGKVQRGAGEVIVLTGTLQMTVNTEDGCTQEVQADVAQAVAATLATSAGIPSSYVLVTVQCVQRRRLQVGPGDAAPVVMDAGYEIIFDDETEASLGDSAEVAGAINDLSASDAADLIGALANLTLTVDEKSDVVLAAPSSPPGPDGECDQISYLDYTLANKRRKKAIRACKLESLISSKYSIFPSVHPVHVAWTALGAAVLAGVIIFRRPRPERFLPLQESD